VTTPKPKQISAGIPRSCPVAPRMPAAAAGRPDDAAPSPPAASPPGSYREIVGVRQHDGWLYLGRLAETAVGRVRLSL
jgi:hypothetical protein